MQPSWVEHGGAARTLCCVFYYQHIYAFGLQYCLSFLSVEDLAFSTELCSRLLWLLA